MPRYRTCTGLYRKSLNPQSSVLSSHQLGNISGFSEWQGTVSSLHSTDTSPHYYATGTMFLLVYIHPSFLKHAAQIIKKLKILWKIITDAKHCLQNCWNAKANHQILTVYTQEHKSGDILQQKLLLDQTYTSAITFLWLPAWSWRLCWKRLIEYTLEPWTLCNLVTTSRDCFSKIVK